MAAQVAVEAIFKAVRACDVEGVMRMLDENARLQFTVSRGETLLIRAAQGPSVEVVRLLVDRGADVNVADGSGYTALFFAAWRGYEEMVSILLQSGADASRRTRSGMTPLYIASAHGREGLVRVLLRHMQGRGLDERDKDGHTALWTACNNGHAKVLRALLLAGADHTVADIEGRTPVQMAEQSRRQDCIAVILEWENELQRGYVLHKARTLHEYTARHLHAPGTRVPALLRPRADDGKPMPHVELHGGGSNGARATRAAVKGTEQCKGADVEKGRDAAVKFVVKDLAAELYTELMAGFHR